MMALLTFFRMDLTKEVSFMKTILELKDVSKEYGEKEDKVEALKCVNVRVYEGEFIAIVGTSGSGKSTMLNLIGGLDTPTKGQICIRGQEIGSLSRRSAAGFRRQNIGFVFQNYSLMPVLNVYENVELPLSFDRGGKRDRAFIERLLKELGIWDKRMKFPCELSGGQKQRVAIARALVNHPAIVLADEPTGNLDSATTGDVMQLLKESCRKFGQTILMVTHNEDLVRRCDRVIRIEDGRITEGGDEPC